MAQAMTQPQNPNQAAGASMLPMSYAAPATALGTVASGTSPLPGTTGPGASTAGQPFGVPVPGVGTGLPGTANPTGFTAPSISTGLSTTDGSNTVVGDFSDTYGKGTGTALVNQLSNLGTATNSAVQATNAQVLQQAGIQEANMKAGQAAAGISPDSSSSALMLGDFNAQVNTGLQATDANMELQGQQTLISALEGEGTAHGPDLSGWDTFGDVLSGSESAISAIAGGVSQNFGVGGAAGSILDTIAML